MKKRWIAVGVAAGVVLLCVGGVWVLKQVNQKTVPVVSMQEMMQWSGGIYDMGFYGNITSDVSQNVYVSSSQTVDEIFVQEGDVVNVGDPLVTYDMTLANIELEMKQLDKQGIELSIQKAERELKKLKNAKPSSSVEDFVEDPGIMEEPGLEDIPEEAVQAYAEIGAEAEPYMGDGTADDPLRYLITEDGIIYGDFFNLMAQEQTYFLLEVREGNVSTGDLLTVWGQKIQDETLQLEPDMQFQMKLDEKNTVINIAELEAAKCLTDKDAGKYYKGDGTQENPYTFLISDEGIVEGSFFNEMRKQKAFFRLEVWNIKENSCGLWKAWEQNGANLEKVDDKSEYAVNLELKLQSGEQTEPEVTPEPGTEPEVTPEPGTEPEVTPEPGIDSEETPESGTEPKATSEFTKDPETTPETGTVPETVTEGQVAGLTTSALYTKTVKYLSLDYVMTSTYDGMTKEDIQKQIEEKEKEIKGYQLDLKGINLELKTMEKELGNQTVKSTITGVVKSVGDPEHPGANGEPLIQVVSSEGLYIQGTISELRLDELQVGDKLNGFSYDTGVSFTAEVREISPYPIESYQEGNASVYPFTAYIENAEGLNNYSYAELTIADGNGSNNATGITLEKPFVRTENGQYYVMIDDGNGKLKKQIVEISGMLYGSVYKISSGLTVEDKIAFPYGKNVAEGTKTEDGTMQDLYG